METKELYDLLHERYTYSDGELISKKTGQPVTAVNSGYKVIVLNKGGAGTRTPFRAHRAIFLMHHGYLPELIDHVDCNKMNNRIENLREATRKQNITNTPVRSNCKAGAKGVRYVPSNPVRPYQARITVNRKTKHLGSFATKEEAASAYAAAAAELHNEYAFTLERRMNG